MISVKKFRASGGEIFQEGRLDNKGARGRLEGKERFKNREGELS